MINRPVFAEAAQRLGKQMGITRNEANDILVHKEYIERLAVATTTEEYRDVFSYIMRRIDPGLKWDDHYKKKAEAEFGVKL